VPAACRNASLTSGTPTLAGTECSVPASCAAVPQRLSGRNVSGCVAAPADGLRKAIVPELGLAASVDFRETAARTPLFTLRLTG